MKIPKHIVRADVLQSLAQLDDGISHRWRVSRKYELVYEGKRYPPKAVLGLTICRLKGVDQHALNLSGGGATNRMLQNLGFEIVEKSVRTSPELIANTTRSND